MLLYEGRVYVTNRGGFNNQTFQFTPDQTLTIIDPETDEVVREVELGDNPNAVEVDSEGNIWVSGSGNIAFNDDFSIDFDNTTPGFLAKVSAAGEIIFVAELPEKASGPSNLEASPEGDVLYFNYLGGIYSLQPGATSITDELEINLFIDQNFYGFSVDESSGDFLGCIAPNFNSSGSVVRFTSTGALIDSNTTGIGPNGATFK